MLFTFFTPFYTGPNTVCYVSLLFIVLSLVAGYHHHPVYSKPHPDPTQAPSNIDETKPENKWRSVENEGNANEADYIANLVHQLEERKRNGRKGDLNLDPRKGRDYSHYPPEIRKSMKRINDLFRKRSRIALKLYEARRVDKNKPSEDEGVVQIASFESSIPKYKHNAFIKLSEPVTAKAALPQGESNVLPETKPPDIYPDTKPVMQDSSLWEGVGIGVGCCVGILGIVGGAIFFIRKRYGWFHEIKLKELSFCNLTPDEPNYVKLSNLHKAKSSSRYIVTVLDESKVSDGSDSMWSSDEEEIFDASTLKSNSPVVAIGVASLTSTPKKNKNRSNVSNSNNYTY